MKTLESMVAELNAETIKIREGCKHLRRGMIAAHGEFKLKLIGEYKSFTDTDGTRVEVDNHRKNKWRVAVEHPDGTTINTIMCFHPDMHMPDFK